MSAALFRSERHPIRTRGTFSNDSTIRHRPSQQAIDRSRHECGSSNQYGTSAQSLAARAAEMTIQRAVFSLTISPIVAALIRHSGRNMCQGHIITPCVLLHFKTHRNNQWNTKVQFRLTDTHCANPQHNRHHAPYACPFLRSESSFQHLAKKPRTSSNGSTAP